MFVSYVALYVVSGAGFMSGRGGPRSSEGRLYVIIPQKNPKISKNKDSRNIYFKRTLQFYIYIMGHLNPV